MSQDNSSMFSDAVYLFVGIPDGTKPSQKNFAEQVVLAAFVYLYKEKLIDIVLAERKSFFRKQKTVKVKKLQSTAPGTSSQSA